MRYDFAVTQARTQGMVFIQAGGIFHLMVVQGMVFIQAGGIPLDGGILHG